MDALYRAHPWGADYLTDYGKQAFASAYHPYEEFRGRPFTGKSIVIGADGFRGVPGAPSNWTKTVWVTGGSVAAGVGTPDWLTIPAELQKRFNEARLPVRVQNRAVTSWVSSQEVVFLTRQLAAGNIPNVIVFVDGFNDIGSIIDSLTAGTPMNHQRLVDFYEGGGPLLNMTATRQRWPGSAFGHWVLGLWREKARVNIPFLPLAETPFYEESRRHTYARYQESSEEEKARLANDVLASYLRNVAFTRRLAKAFGFEAYFFWQPSIYPSLHRKELTALEKNLLDVQPYPHYDVLRRILPRLRRESDVVWAGEAFDGMQETVFTDSVHLTPAGNERLSRFIFARLIRSKALGAR